MTICQLDRVPDSWLDNQSGSRLDSLSDGWLDDQSGSRLDSMSAWYCSPRPQPAIVGVNRVWVCQQHRRRGVASRLLDAIR